MQIIDMPIKYNKSPKKENYKYIVIHDTGNESKGSGVDNHFSYFNGGDRQSSANYFVDDKKIGRFVNPNQFYAWHCGDGNGKYGITNSNSISVEICINNDGNYYDTIINTVWLVKKIMNDFNIPLENVVRHYDASRKCCPKTLIENKYISWDTFKDMIIDKPIPDEKEIWYRVVDSSYKEIEKARERAKQINGFVVEYIK